MKRFLEIFVIYKKQFLSNASISGRNCVNGSGDRLLVCLSTFNRAIARGWHLGTGISIYYVGFAMMCYRFIQIGKGDAYKNMENMTEAIEELRNQLYRLAGIESLPNSQGKRVRDDGNDGGLEDDEQMPDAKALPKRPRLSAD